MSLLDDASVWESIQRLAKRFKDVEDAEQEIALKLLEVQHLYDPARSTPGAFSAVVGERHLLSLARRDRAAKRGRRRTGLLSSGVDVPGSETDPLDEAASRDLAATAIAELTAIDPSLPGLLARHRVSETVRLSGVSRSSLFRVLRSLGQQLDDRRISRDSRG